MIPVTRRSDFRMSSQQQTGRKHRDRIVSLKKTGSNTDFDADELIRQRFSLFEPLSNLYLSA